MYLLVYINGGYMSSISLHINIFIVGLAKYPKENLTHIYFDPLVNSMQKCMLNILKTYAKRGYKIINYN